MIHSLFSVPNEQPMSADTTVEITPIRRQLKDLEARLASLRGYL